MLAVIAAAQKPPIARLPIGAIVPQTDSAETYHGRYLQLSSEQCAPKDGNSDRNVNHQAGIHRRGHERCRPFSLTDVPLAGWQFLEGFFRNSLVDLQA